MNNCQIVPGSLGAIATNTHKTIAETFCQADVVIIIDTSGSMASCDARNGNSRYEVACEELTQLQKNLPGKIALISFSGDVCFCPSGLPVNYGGTTDLSKALNFVKIADVAGMKFIVISDGQPDYPSDCLQIAKTFKNRIDVIYVGPESCPEGRNFLQQLAAATGGKSVTAEKTNNLLNEIQTLLLTASN